MTQQDLARGKRLLRAERTEPFSRQTTYDLSEWLDHHAAELIALAEMALLSVQAKVNKAFEERP